MIISKTPYRISFAGGGTDLKVFYEKEAGAVTSTAINKYIYVTVNKRFDDSIRLSYTKTEIVDNFEELHHELVREAMRKTGVMKGVEITTIGDVPAGTGLGSSSALTVGLLNALYAYNHKHVSQERLAKEACEIEIETIKEPIGKQDQYIAAYGGFKHIQFNPDENVFIDPILLSKEGKKELEGNLMMFYTGKTRSAQSILKEQKENSKERDKFEFLQKMKSIAVEMRDTLKESDLTHFGELLHQGWLYKKKLASAITNNEIDVLYEKARKAGAVGGKICGAGGGGFLLLYADKENHQKIRGALDELKEMPFSFEPQGSKIIYVGD